MMHIYGPFYDIKIYFMTFVAFKCMQLFWGFSKNALDATVWVSVHLRTCKSFRLVRQGLFLDENDYFFADSVLKQV